MEFELKGEKKKKKQDKFSNLAVMYLIENLSFFANTDVFGCQVLNRVSLTDKDLW